VIGVTAFKKTVRDLCGKHSIMLVQLQSIPTQDVIDAQQAWADSIIHMGLLKGNREALEVAVEHHLNNFYCFDRADAIVLFKPTKATEPAFRLSRKSARSYFIGGDADFPEDQGFALNPWTDIQFDNAGIIVTDNYAMAMGHYFFTDPHGQVTKAEYSFGYRRAYNGSLKIHLHHSSVPYAEKCG
jgi:hypothetical protein